MSQMWHIDGEALEIRAVQDAQRRDHFKVTIGDQVIEVSVRQAPDGTLMVCMPTGEQVLTSVSRDVQDPSARWVTAGDQTWVVKEAEAGGALTEDNAGLEAPMPGKVLSVEVSAGDEVDAGQVLLVVEAMKMEHAIRAPSKGKVLALSANAGDMVSPGSPLVDFEAAE